MTRRKAAVLESGADVSKPAATPKATPKAKMTPKPATPNQPVKHRTVEGDGIFVYSVEEVARRLMIGRTLVYRLVGRGEIESFTINGMRRITRDALEQYVRDRVALTSRRSA